MAHPGYDAYGGYQPPPAADTYAPYGSYAPPPAYYPPPYGAPPQAAYGGPPPGAGGVDEVRTVFISGFPADVKERELNNLLRFLPGYEVRGGRVERGAGSLSTYKRGVWRSTLGGRDGQPQGGRGAGAMGRLCELHSGLLPPDVCRLCPRASSCMQLR